MASSERVQQTGGDPRGQKDLSLVALTSEEATTVAAALRAAHDFFSLPDDRKEVADAGVTEWTEYVFVSHLGVFIKHPSQHKTPTEARCECALIEARWAMSAVAKRWFSQHVSEPLRSKLLNDIDNHSHVLVVRWSDLCMTNVQSDPNLVTVVFTGDVEVNQSDGSLFGIGLSGTPAVEPVAVVMVGSMLERITNGFITAARYRFGRVLTANSVTMLFRVRTEQRIVLPGEKSVLNTAALEENFKKRIAAAARASSPP